VFFLAFYPNIGIAAKVASNPIVPSRDWYESLAWMRDNTPDPFQNPDFYYELYEKEGFEYPESAYSVMSWWDYGYWITYVAHRIPICSPGGGNPAAAGGFFTSTDAAAASKMLDRWDSRYVIIDFDMAIGKFYAMAYLSGRSPSKFFETYYERTPEGKAKPMRLYYSEYYRSMCSRLYNFGGKAVVPHNSTWVISFQEMIDEEGNKLKVITTSRSFSTYEEAEEFLARQTSPNYRLVGRNPFLSPVPLEELNGYKLIHRSGSVAVKREEETIPQVVIFEYLKGPK
jgi:dolichyl-diphosphooligosaccharide--protein glycosyltransferase